MFLVPRRRVAPLRDSIVRLRHAAGHPTSNALRHLCV